MLVVIGEEGSEKSMLQNGTTRYVWNIEGNTRHRGGMTIGGLGGYYSGETKQVRDKGLSVLCKEGIVIEVKPHNLHEMARR